ncbi:hypothetical protein FISHEDRAFT_55877 [Fistulina hepatica ATCC 64428]|uniref:Uncharacterized protein n=1 Tax=Fistulina hepatica ATCC 64428 TaxID=1128425 RepID=A0A0D7AMH9_9AGAR|nr:hypothetical protein FISHEDRAFT_55877 [Fistulina hepatica ATCC 64428]
MPSFLSTRQRLELLRSNYVFWEHDPLLPSIHERISYLEQQVSSSAEETHVPELSIELEMLRGLMAPIRRLPNELLLEVFLLSKPLGMAVELNGRLLNGEDNNVVSLQTLLQHEGRIKRLTIPDDFESEPYDPLIPNLLERLSFTFPLLESLHISLIDAGTLTTRLFSKSLQLKWVYLDEVFPHPYNMTYQNVTFACQWEGVEMLYHEARDMAHAWRILTRTFTPAPLDLPCLEVLRLRYDDPDDGEDVNNLFSQLSCPRLRELCISFEEPASFTPHLFMDFAARSSREISDYFAQPRLFDSVVDLTLHLPLVFSRRKGSRSRLWRNMISFTASVPGIPLFPALRKLSIDEKILQGLAGVGVDDQMWDLRDDFVQLVELRRESFAPISNVVCLEELNMPDEWQDYFNREHVRRLKVCESNGLHIGCLGVMRFLHPIY